MALEEWAFPFADNNGDRAYSDEDWAQAFSIFYRNGIVITAGDALKIKQSATGGMKVNVGSGAGIIEGRQYYHFFGSDLVIPVASTLQDRTDSIVLRLDKGGRDIYIQYKQADTSVVRTADIYELQLATIFIGKNSTDIRDANITDKRSDPSVAGYSSPYEDVNVDGLVDQYEDLFAQAFTDTQQAIEANEDAQQDALTLMQSVFQEWLNGLQTNLSGDVAGNLQNQINNLAPKHDAGILIEHGLGEYPTVQILNWEYGLGIVGLGEEPDGMFGGSNAVSVFNKIEYPDNNSLRLYLTDEFMLNNPDVVNQGGHRYLFTEGHRSIAIKLFENGYKN